MKRLICEHHQPVELGYIEWDRWANRMMRKGYKQVRCEVCKLYLFPEELNEPENPEVIENEEKRIAKTEAKAELRRLAQERRKSQSQPSANDSPA